MAPPVEIPGLTRLARPVFSDDRGTFTKIWGIDELPQGFHAREVFWSRSREGVFRGLHVQLPPHDGRKAVFVTQGSVRDFVLDLRMGSPAFGHFAEMGLDPESGGLLIPSGCAHGFEAMTDEVTMVYAQEAVHDAASDGGVNVQSTGIELASETPIISARDLALPSLGQFRSPFVYAP